MDPFQQSLNHFHEQEAFATAGLEKRVNVLKQRLSEASEDYDTATRCTAADFVDDDGAVRTADLALAKAQAQALAETVQHYENEFDDAREQLQELRGRYSHQRARFMDYVKDMLAIKQRLASDYMLSGRSDGRDSFEARWLACQQWMRENLPTADAVIQEIEHIEVPNTFTELLAQTKQGLRQ